MNLSCAPHSDPQSSAMVTLYVDTKGNDRWSGKLLEPNAGKTDGPFATVQRARDAVRELKAGQALKNPITVAIRGGKYYFEETLRFTAEDSGSREFPIRYQAYVGETVILSGGKKLAGWKPYKGQIICAEVPGCKGGVWKFRQIFLNGEPQPSRLRYLRAIG